jgi:nitroreductase
LERILEAGLWAASGKNLQNWRFYVITGKKREEYLALNQKTWLKVKDVLAKRLKPSLYAFTERFFYTLGNAPVVIMAFAEINDLDHPQTQVGNVYLAVENIVLAAQAEGYGSCIMGAPLEIEKEVRNFLGIEDLSAKEKKDWRLVCGITLGKPAHSPPTPPRQRENRIIHVSE